jgi:hypothetical protein
MPLPTGRPGYTHLLDTEPKTRAERELLAGLQEAESREKAWRERVEILQAANVLNEAYCAMLRGQLENLEKKKSKKKSSRLMGDGLPRLLSGDAFYEAVVEHDKQKRQAETEKIARREEREERSEVLARWKEQDDERKKQNEQIKVKYREAVEQWEAAREKAKQEKRRFGVLKPKRGPLLRAIPKPKKQAVVGEGSDEGGDDDDDEQSSDSGDSGDE